MRSTTGSLIKALIASVTCLLSAAPALAQGTPDIVRAPVSSLFVPLGFDSNDNVEITLHGHFSDSCYKVGPSTATVDYSTMTVTLDARAYHYAGSFCAQLIAPYIQPVTLGLVREGTYTVVVKDAPQVPPEQLIVARSRTADPDDFNYAPVEAANVLVDEQGDQIVRLEGTWPLTYVGCMIMKEVRISKTPGNVLLVLPIAEFADGDACEAQRETLRFQIDTKLSSPLEAGDHLIHGRSLNGNSINRLVVIGDAD